MIGDCNADSTFCSKIREFGDRGKFSDPWWSLLVALYPLIDDPFEFAREAS